MAIFNDKALKQFRRDLRKNASRGEKALWNGLRKIGIGAKFRRQESIGSFVVDFYCPELCLAIEVDGIHHEHTREYDAMRDRILNGRGVRVLRFTDSEVIDNGDAVLERIRTVVHEMREAGKSRRRPSTQYN